MMWNDKDIKCLENEISILKNRFEEMKRFKSTCRGSEDDKKRLSDKQDLVYEKICYLYENYGF